MKKINFGAKPNTAPAPTGHIDAWVHHREHRVGSGAGGGVNEPTKRLTLDVSLSLHRRMKTQCAIDDLVMADVIRGLLEKRFPEPKPAKINDATPTNPTSPTTPRESVPS